MFRSVPSRSFVSHSYRDSEVLADLLDRMPKRMEAVTFPRVEPDPERAVSDDVIPRILGCSGLIYLEGGASQHSFWVEFERDYALRSGLKVFAYDPEANKIRRVRDSPIDLTMEMVYHSRSQAFMDRLFSWMADKRHFDLRPSMLHTRTGGLSGDTMVAQMDLALSGTPTLWLMSPDVVRVADTYYSRDLIRMVREFEYDSLNDDTIREWAELSESEEVDEDVWVDYWSRFSSVYARIDPDLSPAWHPDPFQGYSEYLAGGGHQTSDESRMVDLFDGREGSDFNWNRVDDLIIRIYQAFVRGP